MEVGNVRKDNPFDVRPASDLLYTAPWLCYSHGIVTFDKAFFFRHLLEEPHYHEGMDGTCESCGLYLPNWRCLYRGLKEPPIILCRICELIPDIIQKIVDKRKSQYPELSIET
jgi:hypothetical protein